MRQKINPQQFISHYFGSPINKFINEECSQELTCVNIDAAMFKRNKRWFRIIESKYSNEGAPFSQIELLYELAQVLCKEAQVGYFEVCVVIGDPPYTSGAIVKNMCNGKFYKLNREDLIDWLNFERKVTEFEEIEHGLKAR